mgnify:CR=1 FL=1
MIIDRVWAMPNCRTFSIKPVAELIEMYRPEGISIDPFSNNARLADITNDLNPDCESDFHLDAKDFLEQFEDESISMVLYDPLILRDRYLSVTSISDIRLIWKLRKAVIGKNIRSRLAGLFVQAELLLPVGGTAEE